MRLTNSLPLLALALTAAAQPPQMPMQVRFEDSAEYRWLQKPVLGSRLLDDMDNPSTWAPGGKCEMTFTREGARAGMQSLRIHAQAVGGRGYPSVWATRAFHEEDWSAYNRVSFWLYADFPGFENIGMFAAIDTAVKDDGMGANGRDSRHYFNLKNHRWTHIVWEVAHLPRGKVTGFTVQYIMVGKPPDAPGDISFDIEHLELQRIAPDHYEGWNVAAGAISYSYSGYQTGAVKTAISSDLEARDFQVIRYDTGETVISKPVRTEETHLGRFQVLDFSELREPGTYVLRAGGRETYPFPVGDDVWRNSIWKAINFFYSERCGMEIPGLHPECHRDWLCSMGDRKIFINGGWHDAGDLSQGPVNTAEAAYAMLGLAERLRARGEDPELERRVREEAIWGVKWLLKSTFGKGYRSQFAPMTYWSDGILGTPDDAIVRAQVSPFEDYLAASAEALAARVLKDTDASLAARSLQAAREDWQAAIETAERGGEIGNAGSRGGNIDTVAAAVQASIDLFEATGEERYGTKAVEFSDVLLRSQQRNYLPGAKVPLAGFFYTGPEKERILHYEHRAHEQGPVVALARLCDVFPDNPNWIRWYTAVALYSEYLKTAAQYTAPYGMLPASVYREDEYVHAPERQRESRRRQIMSGTEIAKGYRLRLLPVWYDYRGNEGVMLSQAKGLSTAAQLRGSLDSAELAQRQLEWAVGRNPFVESLMYGEGHNFIPYFTPSTGDMVGALPVGIESLGDHDVPYWPDSASYVYKEVWVHPVARWISLMTDLSGPASISGQAEAGEAAIELREAVTGKTLTIRPDLRTGAFHAWVPEGRYAVRSRAGEKEITLLPGGSYNIDLAPKGFLDFTVSGTTRPDGRVTIRVAARGRGAHRFAIRADNLSLSKAEQQLDLSQKQEIFWEGKVNELDAPWVAVVAPDGDLSGRKEAIGGARQ